MKRSLLTSIFVVLVLLGMAGCASQTVPTQTAVVQAPPTETPQMPAATSTTVQERTLTVLAAASLTESFTELGELFEEQHPGVTVLISFAGSQQLAQQLGEGAPADVFASASKKYIQAAVDAGRVSSDDVEIFAYNRLVVIFPQDNPGGVEKLLDLAKSGLKLDLADKSVPVGQYSLDFLDRAVADPAFGANFKDDVLNNVVSYEENVKSVLTKVSLGEADAGIVYVTDITPEAAKLVGTIDIPDELNTIATYPIAPIADSSQLDLAKAFVDLVLSPEGTALLGKYGFIPPSE